MTSVRLDDLIAAVSRYPLEPSSLDLEWAIVDQSDHVLLSGTDRQKLFVAFHAKVEEEPAMAGQLRLIGISRHGGTHQYWPAEETALERARLAHKHSFSGIGESRRAEAHLRERFLQGRRGTLNIDAALSEVIELTWPDPDGNWERLGLLVRQGKGPWSLLVDHNRRETEAAVIEQRLAEVVQSLAPSVAIDSSWIRTHRKRRRNQTSYDMHTFLIELAVRVAEEFGLLNQAGDELR